MKRKTRYAFGGTKVDPLLERQLIYNQRVNNSLGTVESPQAALMDNEMRAAKAMQEAESNPWTQALDVLGSLAVQYGTSTLTSGLGNMKNAGTNNNNASQSSTGSLTSSDMDAFNTFNMLSNKAYAYGGKVKNKMPNGGTVDKQKKLTLNDAYGMSPSQFNLLPQDEQYRLKLEKYKENTSLGERKEGFEDMTYKLNPQELQDFSNYRASQGNFLEDYENVYTNYDPKSGVPLDVKNLSKYQPVYKQPVKTAINSNPPTSFAPKESQQFYRTLYGQPLDPNKYDNLAPEGSLSNIDVGTFFAAQKFRKSNMEDETKKLNSIKTAAQLKEKATPEQIKEALKRNITLRQLFEEQGQKFAFGGSTGSSPVEVEGGELGQLPNGELLDFIGPDHSEGGIDVVLPDGTDIFSKRIKIDGVTMADRKKKRERNAAKLEKLLANDSTDVLLKNSVQRNAEVSEAENAFDVQLQNTVAASANSNKKAMGGTTGIDPNAIQFFLDSLQQGNQGNEYIPVSPLPVNTNINFGGSPVMQRHRLNQIGELPVKGVTADSVTKLQPLEQRSLAHSTKVRTTPQENEDFINSILGFMTDAGTPTIGDLTGMFGNLKQAYSPRNLTLGNRAGDTPNINPYENYGKAGLQTLQSGKDYITQVRDENLSDLNLARNAAIKRNRNSARGINTQRALDLTVDSGVNRNMSDLYSTFASQMLGITGQEAQMQNQQDQMVMRGEQMRDLADRQDRDNFFTQLARDEQAIGEAVSGIGKNVNQIKERGVNEDFLNAMYDYIQGNMKTGNITVKNTKKKTKTK